MGYRTVVILANDQQHEWEKDAELGQKIAKAAAARRRVGGGFDYGNVVEVEHADVQRLVVIDSYNTEVLAEKSWHRSEGADSAAVALLKQAAEALGYKLVRA